MNIKIQNCNIITHDVNSKMSIKKYKVLFLILAVITLHRLEGKTMNEKKAESGLIESNKIMAAEIESLKATVAKLRENDTIRNLLDVKQSEWIEIKEENE